MEDILEKFNPWWDGPYPFPGIKRSAYLLKLEQLLDVKDVILITGLRRVGKTTLMHQFIHRLLRHENPKRILYVSLDYLSLKDYTILQIEDAFRKVNSLRHDEKVFMFLDEVHVQKDFELQLKNLYDLGHSKIFASGSANLDIIMRSSYLTGRQRLVRIDPLSFGEYMRFRNLEISRADTHLYASLAREYVEIGGIPEYVLTRDPNVLQSLIDTILYKDISDRYEIRNRNNVKNILMMAARTVSSPMSLNRISRVLGIRHEVVTRVVHLLIEANLLHIVERDGKFNERNVAPKKLYVADTGLFSVLTERTNLGAKVENTVFLTLSRSGAVRYSNQSGEEVDFIQGRDACEVKFKREIEEKDMANIKDLRGMKSKTIVTESVDEVRDGIGLVPLWKFLREQEREDRHEDCV